MTAGVFGPIARIDGPPPIRRPYGLLQAAEAPSTGVRIVIDPDGLGIDRWANAVETSPYPKGKAYTFDQCAATGGSKAKGESAVGEQFGSFLVYMPYTCTAHSVGDHADFKRKLLVAFAPVEDHAVERVLLAGDGTMILNARLADGTGSFPNGNGVTSAISAIQLLEKEIANKGFGRLGVIHMSPQVALAANAQGTALVEKNGILRTVNGTPVIPGTGYADGTTFPTGKSAPANTNEEWVYASGPIDIRRGDVFTVPDTPAEATDRSSNEVTYRAERQYVIDWDTTIHAAVRVDRCRTTC